MFQSGELIRKWRQELNLSQARLAKELGLQQAILSAWELGKKEPLKSELETVRKKIDEINSKVTAGELKLNKKNIVSNKSQKDAGEDKNPPVLMNAQEYLDRKAHIKYSFSSKENEEFLKELNTLGEAVRCSISENKDSTKPKGIAFFAGCGGLSLGFKAAGFDIVGFVEIDETARRIYEANFPGTVCLGNDITKIEDTEVQRWREVFGHIDVLIGGPPCQGFSLVGKRDPSDMRNELYLQYSRIASILKPDAFVLENVRLMTSMKDKSGKPFFPQVIKAFKEIGYKVEYRELNALDYGVPQSRERVIVIGVRDDLDIEEITFPEPDYSLKQSNQISFFEKASNAPVTFRHATGDLEALEAGQWSKHDPYHWAISHPQHVINWLKNVPEGKSAHENEDPALRPSSGYNTTYKRILWDEPSSTISTNFNMISGSRNVHPENTRSLTIREAARCQTFPDNFAFFGNWGDIRRVIGNAVPPLLGRKIASHIREKLLRI